MRILVTGATGFLGRTLLSLTGEAEWIGCGRRPAAEGVPYRQVNLADRKAVIALVAELAPDWVINAAAMTDVDGCEKDAPAARQANVDIPENLAAACEAIGAGLVHISTDYVFDGKRGPYREGDTTNPLSCYGQLKLESEGILKKMERVLVVRTLWLYGYVPQAGSNFLTWVLRALVGGQPLRVFADQWGNPTYIRDLARALVSLCGQEARGLFHAGGATFMTRWEMAREMACFFGIDGALIESVPTRAAGLLAARPLRSGLRTDALETALGRRPLSFAEGLQHLAADPHFRRDFPQFAR
jgi:dTDP-4-dehydrorhamnose reductase